MRARLRSLRNAAADVLILGAKSLFELAGIVEDDKVAAPEVLDDTREHLSPTVPKGSEIIGGVTLSPEARAMLVKPQPKKLEPKPEPLVGGLEERLHKRWGDFRPGR